MTMRDKCTDTETARFIALFADPQTFEGALATYTAMGHLPEGVNRNHPEVVRIIGCCRQRSGYAAPPSDFSWKT